MSSPAYRRWLSETGVSSVPARDRRTLAREELLALEQTLYRVQKTKEHAPTLRDAVNIEAKIERLEERAAVALNELGGGAYVNGDPIAPTCTRCGEQIDRHQADYGVCRACLSSPTNPNPRRF